MRVRGRVLENKTIHVCKKSNKGFDKCNYCRTIPYLLEIDELVLAGQPFSLQVCVLVACLDDGVFQLKDLNVQRPHINRAVLSVSVRVSVSVSVYVSVRNERRCTYDNGNWGEVCVFSNAWPYQRY